MLKILGGSWPGSGLLVLRCRGPGFTVLARGLGFRPILILILIQKIIKKLPPPGLPTYSAIAYSCKYNLDHHLTATHGS